MKQWDDIIKDCLNIWVADVFHHRSYKTNIANQKLVPGLRTKLQLPLLVFSMSKSLIKWWTTCYYALVTTHTGDTHLIAELN